MEIFTIIKWSYCNITLAGTIETRDEKVTSPNPEFGAPPCAAASIEDVSVHEIEEIYFIRNTLGPWPLQAITLFTFLTSHCKLCLYEAEDQHSTMNHRHQVQIPQPSHLTIATPTLGPTLCIMIYVMCKWLKICNAKVRRDDSETDTARQPEPVKCWPHST